MIVLTHYDYTNIGRIHSKEISKEESYREILEAFWRSGSNMTGISVDYENKRVHGSISNMHLERLKREHPKEYIEMIQDSIAASFHSWEMQEDEERKSLVLA